MYTVYVNLQLFQTNVYLHMYTMQLIGGTPTWHMSSFPWRDVMYILLCYYCVCLNWIIHNVIPIVCIHIVYSEVAKYHGNVVNIVLFHLTLLHTCWLADYVYTLSIVIHDHRLNWLREYVGYVQFPSHEKTLICSINTERICWWA